MFAKILIPVDGSDTAWKALEDARQLAGHFQSELLVLYVVQQYFTVPTLSLGDDVAVIPVTISQLEEVGRELLDEARRRLGDYSRVQTRMDFGHPAERILAAVASEKCDSVVIGSRGLSSIAGFMMGSVSSKVAQHARVPVLIVK